MTDILYCGNDKVFDGVLTSSLSIVRRLDAPRPLTIHIFTMELTRVSPNYLPMTRHHADIIETALRRHNPDTHVKLYDVTALYEQHLKQNANEGCYCSPYTLLRLLAAQTEATIQTEPVETKPQVELKLDRTDMRLQVGYSTQLKLVDCGDLKPEDVEWSVEHAYIAKVENGYVTALQSGTTEITAKYGDQTVKCIVRCHN